MLNKFALKLKLSNLNCFGYSDACAFFFAHSQKQLKVGKPPSACQLDPSCPSRSTNWINFNLKVLMSRVTRLTTNRFLAEKCVNCN